MKRPEWRLPPLAVALLAAVASLAPFAHKAVHIDDPLFLWTARQMQQHPLDPYGIEVNWYGTPQPIARVINNPPLVPAYAALVAAGFGWSEVALHLGFLVPALLVVWGTFALARRFGAPPLLAALATLWTPVFLVSATTMMCDVMMLAFGVWAVVLWDSGLREKREGHLWLAAFLCGLATLAKFNGITFWPLLLLHGFLIKRQPGRWLVPLAVPLVILGAFEGWTARVYGQGLFLASSAYASDQRMAAPQGADISIGSGLIFLGGCCLPVLFYAPFLGSRQLWPAALAAGLAVVFVLPAPGIDVLKSPDALQAAMFATAGVGTLTLAGLEAWQRRDATALLLAAWVLGTFLYASVINWTINARGFLTLAPAVGLLIARRLESTPGGFLPRRAWPLLPAAALSFLVTLADCRLADSARAAARQIAQIKLPQAANLWFLGHWGFQYYMESQGGRPVDLCASRLGLGDVLVFPWNNSNTIDHRNSRWESLETISLQPNRWLTTMDRDRVGFYASAYGALPFALGPVTPERYWVTRIVRPVVFAAQPASAP